MGKASKRVAGRTALREALRPPPPRLPAGVALLIGSLLAPHDALAAALPSRAHCGALALVREVRVDAEAVGQADAGGEPRAARGWLDRVAAFKAFRPFLERVVVVNAELHERDRRSVRALAGGEIALRAVVSGACGDQRLRVWAGAQALEGLVLSDCGALRALGPLATLSRLTHLVLYGCARLEDLAPLGACRALRCVELYGANRVRDLATLAACAALEDLLISQSIVSDLAPLAALPLRSLALVNCPRVEDLSPLAASGLCQLLLLGTGVQAAQLAPFTKLTNLVVSEITDLSALAGHPLCKLYLSHCVHALDFTPLASCPALRTLILDHCQDVGSFGPLDVLTQLTIYELCLDCNELHETRGPISHDASLAHHALLD